MVALLENDYAIVRRYEGRSSFGGFIAAVVEHLLIDRLNAERGRWNPSAEAQRMGEAAMALERLIYRDSQPLDAALPVVRAIDPAITRAAAEAMLARLPVRKTRPRAVDLEAVNPEAFPSHEEADAGALASDAKKTAHEASRVVREHLDTLPAEDRVLLRLRFGADMSVADVSRALQIPQRPLYRKIESLLGSLRRVLHASRIDESAAAGLIGASAETPLDFGLTDWKNDPAQQTFNEEQR
jgi:RNA polymerase sigma factor (sigma-70 family)